MLSYRGLLKACLLATTVLAAPPIVWAQVNTIVDDNNGTRPLPTGQYITPTKLAGAVQQFLNPGYANYPNYVAGEAVRSQLSPDGQTLLVLCAGYNNLRTPLAALDPAASTQLVFIYDVSGANQTAPVLKQVVQPPNSWVGLAWAPSGTTFYVAGGVDDVVYVYTQTGGSYQQSAAIALGHAKTGIGLGVQPNAGGLAVSADGKTLVVANNFNDSISVIDTASNTVRYEHDLRPFFANNEGTPGVAGGEYPWAVVLQGNGRAYVSSNRDRQVVVVDVSAPTAGRLIARIKLDGNGTGMVLNTAQTQLYVAQDNADEVAVIDTATNTVTAEIDTRAPAGVLTGPHYTGASPYAATVSPDGKTLYVVNEGSNSIAVIPLTGPSASTVAGLIPTAWNPHDVTFSADGGEMYIINGKSDQGPNPGYLFGNTAALTTLTYPGGNAAAATAGRASNQYDLQLHHASLVSARTPTSADLPSLTSQVAQNDLYTVPPDATDTAVMGALHSKIQHIIYIVKENRTYDQILGDLTNGSNGDAPLAVFGKRITPNFHRIATNFTTLDNFFDSGDASMDGWGWSLQGRLTSTLSLTQQINYASARGLSYESEGDNRNVPAGLSTLADRQNATAGAFASNTAALPGGTSNVLPGLADVAATDTPAGIGTGYIFDAVVRKGLTLRNYGFMVNNIGSIGTKTAPEATPFTDGVVQVAPVNRTMAMPGITDLYFRGYDQNYPDQWRVNEWQREFNTYVTAGTLPNMMTVRVSHDHTGSFGTALAGVNTPETQQADNDYAVGRIVDTVAHSPFAGSTLVFVIEDDCQDGPDHVDAHRSTAYVVGPYVKQNAVVSTRYTTVNMLRTIEDILGLDHLNLNTAYQRPMTDVFDLNQATWTYSAVASTVLRTTTAMNEAATRYAEGPQVTPKHDAAYWDHATRGFDFSGADRVPVRLFNEVLWSGLTDGAPYPTDRDGRRKGITGVTIR